MHSDITFIASDLLAAEKVQNILRESPANCQVVLSNTQDLEEVSRSQVAQGAKVLIAFGMFAKIVRQSVDVPDVYKRQGCSPECGQRNRQPDFPWW